MTHFYNSSFQLLFSYGANMNPQQLKLRNVRAEVFSLARLQNFRLGFFGHCSKWDGPEESLLEAPEEDLWGVVYKLSFSALEDLDAWQDARLDGTGNYFHYPAEVLSPNGEILPVLLYRKESQGEEKKPSLEFLNFICEGARIRALPETYIKTLEARETVKASYPVPIPARFDRAMLAKLSCDCG